MTFDLYIVNMAAMYLKLDESTRNYLAIRQALTEYNRTSISVFHDRKHIDIVDEGLAEGLSKKLTYVSFAV